MPKVIPFKSVDSFTNQIAAVDGFQYDALATGKSHSSGELQKDKKCFEYTYDGIIHSYIIKTKDAYGYGDGKNHEFRFGNLIHSTSMQESQFNTI